MRESAVVDRHVNQDGRGFVMPRAPRTHRADWTLGNPPALGDDSPMDVWTEKLSRSDRALRRHENFFLLGAAEAGLTRDVSSIASRVPLSSSSTAVMIELRIASTIDEFVTRARVTRDDRARGNEYDLEVVATHQ